MAMERRDSLLIEIGCEEIPARMISSASAQFLAIVGEVLDDAELEHGETTGWGGSRRLAVHVASVQTGQSDRDETVHGPPASVAYAEDGSLTRAAEGFAKKQGIAPASLERLETDRGPYVGFVRRVRGRSVGEILADRLPERVAKMTFPKSMRWAEGVHRWVRPVHWVVALHGDRVLEVSLFDVAAGRRSTTHRFLGPGTVEIENADAYVESLRTGYVLVEREARRRRLSDALAASAKDASVVPVADDGLMNEIADLAEWPSVVRGSFDPVYLDLPREILITTLRHHQKCFAAEVSPGKLAPYFFAVADADRDPAGHIRRGNEWVVGGRLEDARFFWNEDRGVPFDTHIETLKRVTFHRAAGSYAEKAKRLRSIVERLADALELDRGPAMSAAERSKHDLVTGTVGEFPELQGVVGGLLLEAEGEDPAVARAVYEHYRPVGADDPLPESDAGALVSIADRLDTVASLIGAGERPTGSKDPFGLRRAVNGAFRILLDRGWTLDLRAASAATGSDGDGRVELETFLAERLEKFFRDRGATANEVRAVLRATRGEGDTVAFDRALPEIERRLSALRAVRGREDFAHLVELVKRVDNIAQKNAAYLESIADEPEPDVEGAAAALRDALTREDEAMHSREARGDYVAVIESIARLVEPTAAFFDDVLVIDKERPSKTRARYELLRDLKRSLTRCFDVRELSGEAAR